MEKRKPAGPEVIVRKRVLKKKQAEYPDRKMAWIGGILYFTDTNPPTEVMGAKERPKDGKEAKGLAAAFPFPPARRRNVPSPSRRVCYQDLPQAKDTYGQCSHCGHYPNFAKWVKTADLGPKEVIECILCHTPMRPYARRRTSI